MDSLGQGTYAIQFNQKTSLPSRPLNIVFVFSSFSLHSKTTALKHLLENAPNDLKIGVIVNDVASVNIDAKLVTGQQTLDNSIKSGDVVELQNGCACCSLADELFTSVEQLLTRKDKDNNKRELDAIVVELSGVADPMAIKSNWRVACPEPIRKMADVSRVVTLVDATTFGTDYMTWDEARQRQGWVDPADECAGNRKVAELLAEQVEAANLILVNKVDLASDDEVKIASSVARALNEKAELVEVEYGRLSPMHLLTEDDEEIVAKEDESHAHDCDDPNCDDPSHSHSHSHEHAKHGDSHDHSHSHDHSCDDPDCTDASHSHSHDHACEDPDCTDTSHSHSHSHSTSTDELGITNFVYKASVPFHPKRLMSILQKWPIPKKDTLDLGLLTNPQDGFDADKGQFDEDSPFIGVVRSKGFCWFAPSKWSGANEDPWRHDTAMYWSHAGKHFSVTAAGKWWGTIGKEQMKKYFDNNNMDEYERIVKEDFVSEEFGDRRQELVFIGTGFDEEKIRAALDACLLNESEMGVYRQKLRNYLDTIMTTTASGPGLFDVGSVDHLE